MHSKTVCLFAIVALTGAVSAQSPVPVIVPAMTPATATAPAAPDEGSLQAAVRLLQEMKAANEETLRKQAAMLQQLDELEKAAQQIKIFTKRT